MQIRAMSVLFITSLFFFYEFGLNNIFNTLEHDIALEYALSTVTIGLISSLYFYANILFLLPAGLLLDRFSPRKIITLAMLTCSTGVLIVGLSSTLSWLVFARILMGFGGGFCFIGCIRIAINWFPSKQIAIASGFIVTMGMLGGFMVQAPMSWLISQHGWRGAMNIVALVGYIITLLIWAFVQDAPHASIEQIEADQQNVSDMGLLSSIRAVLKQKQNWLCGLYTSMMNLPIYVLGALWGVPYLMAVHHLSHFDAASICGMLFIGTMFGSMAVNAISNWLMRRRAPMIAGAILALILMMIILRQTDPSIMRLNILFFALGFVTSTQAISYPTLIESNPHKLASTATAIISTLSLTGGAIAEPLFGYLLERSSTEAISNGNHLLYSESAYHSALSLLPFAFIAALFCVDRIKETRCQSQY